MSDLEDFEKRLHAVSPEDEEFYESVDSLIEELGVKLGASTIPAIFCYFEKYPLDDMGAPGTLVHFVEKFYPSYKDLLIQSIKVRPSCNTILMANRILNSKLAEVERSEYLAALNYVSESSNFDEILRDEAKNFIQYQSNK